MTILEPIRTADGHVLDAVETAAYEAMMSRVTWSSLHWGVEGVHRDAWPHLAIAAATGARSEVERLRAVQCDAKDPESPVGHVSEVARLRIEHAMYRSILRTLGVDPEALTSDDMCEEHNSDSIDD